MKKQEKQQRESAPAVDDSEVSRGRPGRRSAADRREAVMALLAGKASIDQLAKQYGVHPSTVEGWRDAAVTAVEQAMALGGGPTAKERELAKEVDQLRSALAQATLERAIAMQGVEEWKRASRPSRPARSRR